MDLIVRCPRSFAAERSYVLDVLLGHFLGLSFQLTTHDRACVELEALGKTLRVRDAFLGGDERAWLTPQSLPKITLPKLDSAALVSLRGLPRELPVLYGEAGLRIQPNLVELDADVFAGCFFMLSRYEEQVSLERDAHDRFPASASLALKHGFIDYPIVNAYLEVLWACMVRLWPGLRRRERSYQTVVSCDVDWPYDPTLRSLRKLAARSAYDLLRAHDFRLAGKRLRDAARVRVLGPQADPFNCFEQYMTWVQQRGLRAAFNFICDHSGGAVDGVYSLGDAEIQALLRRIHERGHEIGLHPSYNTYRDAAQLQHEFSALKRSCGSLGIEQDQWGGRQHFLRWAPSTFRLWDDAGLDYDSTLSFADRAGFRAGTCYAYPAYDLQARKALRLSVRPLVAMEVSLLAAEYMGLDHAQAHDKLAELRGVCRELRGDFTLLWHNSSLGSEADRELFRSCLV